VIFFQREKNMSDNDTKEPILVLIRRGRKGRGFSASPVDDLANPAMCADASELGEVIIELLDDPKQPRVNVQELLNAAQDEAPSGDDRRDDNGHDGNEDEEDGEEEEEEGGIFSGLRDAEDPADQFLINLFSAAVNKGRDLSSKPRKSRARSRRRRPRKQ
jgi:hypothetical protein